MNILMSRLTMTFVVVIFIGGVVLGFVLLFQPASTQVEEDPCNTQTVDKGDELTTNLVTLNIFNSGKKAGLANRVSINLQRKGFLAGEVGNAPEGEKTSNVTVLAKDLDHPAAKLVSKQFKGKVKVREPAEKFPDEDLSDQGIAVVVGPNYDGIKKKAPRKVKSDRHITVCVPLETDEEDQ